MNWLYTVQILNILSYLAMVPFLIFFLSACILALSRVEPLLSLAAEFAASFILRYIHSLFVHAYYPYPYLLRFPPK